MSNKAEVLMSLKDEISGKVKHIKGEFRTLGLVGKASMMALSAGISFAKYALTKFGNAVSWAYHKVIGLTKAVAVGLVGAFALATKVAITQEAAEFKLAAALKATGEYTEKSFAGFKKYASALQSVTVYGDEEILGLMQMLTTLGVTSNQLERATKMSIALAAAIGMDTNATSKYIAMAMAGDAQMLSQYIPALKTTKDKTEQLAIVTDFCAKAFKIAQAEAQTTRGSLTQMKNSVGDALEAFATPFLGGFVRSAKSIKDWCESNNANIANWGRLSRDAFERWGMYSIRSIQLVKKDMDAFFGSTDAWQTKMDVLTSSVTDMFTALAKTTYRAGVNAGELLWQGITDGFANKYAANMVAIEDTYNKTTPKDQRSWWGLEKMYWGGEKGMTPEQRKIYQQSKNAIYEGYENNDYDIAGRAKHIVQPVVDSGKRAIERFNNSNDGTMKDQFEENKKWFDFQVEEDRKAAKIRNYPDSPEAKHEKVLQDQLYRMRVESKLRHRPNDPEAVQFKLDITEKGLQLLDRLGFVMVPVKDQISVLRQQQNIELGR